jgi:hypothetical protein
MKNENCHNYGTDHFPAFKYPCCLKRSVAPQWHSSLSHCAIMTLSIAFNSNAKVFAHFAGTQLLALLSPKAH